MPNLLPKAAAFSPGLRAASGWLLLGCMVLAPFAYGTTSWWAEKLLAEILFAAFGFWALSQVSGKFVLRFNLVDFSLLYLLLTGWWMAINSHSLYDANYRTFFYLTEIAPAAPGSIDQLASLCGMERITGLFCAFLIARSLGSEKIWRLRILVTAALTGFFTAICGIALKIDSLHLMPLVWPPSLLWETNFAFFHYHANAGSYLNLTWPLAMGLGVRALLTRETFPGKWFWLGSACLIFIGIQINFSKAAIAIALLLLALFAFEWIRQTHARFQKRVLAALAGFIFISLMATTILANFSHYRNAWRKWEELPRDAQPSIVYRLEIQRISLHMAGDAGWWGFGPESFEAAFAHYQDIAGKPPGKFDEAHEDYLQTIIEWGAGGMIAWTYLTLGGLWKIWRRLLTERPQAAHPAFWLWHALFLALLGVFIHAGFDFPLEIDSIRLYVLVFLALGWSGEPVTCYPSPASRPSPSPADA
jgi:hypothetical protein